MRTDRLSSLFNYPQKGIDYLEFDIESKPIRILVKPIARIAHVGNIILRNIAKVIENIAMVVFNFLALAFTRGKSVGDLWHTTKQVAKGTGTILIAIAFLFYRKDTRTKPPTPAPAPAPAPAPEPTPEPTPEPEDFSKLSHEKKLSYYREFVCNLLLRCSDDVKKELLRHINSVAQIDSKSPIYEGAVEKLRAFIKDNKGEFGSDDIEKRLTDKIEECITVFEEERQKLQEMCSVQYLPDTRKLTFPTTGDNACTVKEYLSYFLRVPIGLKYEEVEKNLTLLKEGLEGKEEVELHRQVHERMKDLLSEEIAINSHQASELLKQHQLPSEEELEARYSANKELKHLAERRETIQAEDSKLSTQNVAPHEFGRLLLARELKCLEAAEEKLRANNEHLQKVKEALANNRQQTLDKLNELIGIFCNNATDSLGMIKRSAPDLQTRVEALQTKIGDLQKLSSDDTTLTDQLHQVEEELASLKKDWIKRDDISNRCSYLSSHEAMREKFSPFDELLTEIEAKRTSYETSEGILERREIMQEYKEQFADEVALLAMEKRSDIQFLLEVSLLDARSKGADLEVPLIQEDRDTEIGTVNILVRKEARNYVRKLQRENASTVLHSVETQYAFVFEVNEEANAPSDRENRAINLDEISKKIKTSDIITNWQQQLEKRWLKSLTPRDYEALSSAPGHLRRQFMTQHFRQWVYRNTGVECYFLISLDAIASADDQQEAKKEKSNPIVEKTKETPYMGKLRDTIARRKAAAASPSAVSSADFQCKLLQVGAAVQGDIASLPNIAYATTGNTAEASNVLDVLRGYPAGDSIQELSDWIVRFKDSATSDEFEHHKQRVLVAFRKLFSQAINTDTPVDDRITATFFNCYKVKRGDGPPEFDFDTLGNENRDLFLYGILTIVLTQRGNPKLQVTADVHNYLVQFYRLAFCTATPNERKFFKDKLQSLITTNEPRSMRGNASFREIGSALQGSPIGLEGVDDNVAQKALQGLRTKIKRDDIDFIRSRSGENRFAHELLPLLRKLKPAMLIHPQHRQQWARAIDSALAATPRTRKDKAAVLAELNNLLQRHPLPPDPSVDDFLTVPLSIFFRERILADPDIADDTFKEHNEAIRSFNEQLLRSKETNIILLGASREITRMSKELRRPTGAGNNLSPEEFATLLRYKATYQKIKTDYFTGKRVIRGYLKDTIEEAEALMRLTTPQMEQYIKTTDPKTILPFLQPSPDEDAVRWGRYCNSVFETILPANLERDDQLPGFCKAGRSNIDAVYGAIYDKDTQHLQLPPQLKNHPDARLLSINGLPYSRDPNNAFCYFSNDENGNPIVQVKVFESTPPDIVIQRNLPTEFDGTASTLLQYVSKGKMLKLPRSIATRMGIETFWCDDKGVFYGFDHNGILQVKLDKGAEGKPLVELKGRGKFSPIFDSRQQPATSLLACFNQEDVLASTDGNRFFVPGCGLMAEKRNGSWMCEAPFFTGVLSLDTTRADLLAIRRQGAQGALDDLAKKEKETQDEIERIKAIIDTNPHHAGTRLHLNAELKEQQEKFDGYAIERREILGGQYITTVPSEVHRRRETLGANELVAKISPYCKQPALTDDEQMQTQAHLGQFIQDNFAQQQVSLFDAARQLYAQSSNQLENSYTAWSQSLPATEQQRLNEYQQTERVHKTICLYYEQLCKEPLGEVLFSQMEGQIYAQGLSGSLLLAARVKEQRQLTEVLEQLSEHSLTGPLNDKQLALLNQAKNKLAEEVQGANPPVAEAIQLHNYLCLVAVQHYQLLIKEFAHLPLRNRMGQYRAIEAELDRAKREASNASKQFSNGTSSPAFAVREMWKKTSSLFQGNGYNDMRAKYAKKSVGGFTPEFKKGKLSVRRSYINLGRKSLLDRLGLQEEVEIEPKDLAPETPTGFQSAQRDIVDNFQDNGSSDQVKGFFLEEFGLFDEKNLVELFSIPPQESGNFPTQGAFKATEQDIRRLFSTMKEAGWITGCPPPLSHLYSVNTTINPFTFFNSDSLRATLADSSYTEEQIAAISERIHNFLARAHQARCNYSLPQGKHPSIEENIKKEIKEHALEFRSAENWMRAQLGDHYEEGLKEMHYALLTEDYSRLCQLVPTIKNHIPELRNAFVRYLIHKTEWQHLNNAQKAKYSGERNKIELLAMRRNYPVDLIVSTNLFAEQKEEQRRQLAFLLFEENIGFRCNIPQVQMFRSFLVDSKDPDAIDAAQARMGFGKTSLLPIIALVKLAEMRESEQRGALAAEDKKMVRYVVPYAVLADNTYAFDRRLASILGVHAVKDTDFQRYQLGPDHLDESIALMQSDLDARKAFYERVRNEGLLLIQWPEIRNSIESQENDLREILRTRNLGSATKKALSCCLNTLRKIRSMHTLTVFDELDDTQDDRSREVNYTQGSRLPANPMTLEPMLIIIDKINTGGYDLKATEDCKRLVCDVLNDLHWSTADGVPGIDPANPLIAKLLNKKEEIPETVDDSIGNDHPYKEQLQAACFLLRSVLSDESMLSMVKEKQPNTQFGVRFAEQANKRLYYFDSQSGSASLFAVPYAGTNTPKGDSVYDNTEVASFATLRYYLYPETLFEQYPHLDFLVEQTNKEKIPDIVRDMLQTSGKKEVWKELQDIANMREKEEIRRAKECFFNKYMKDPSREFRKFFGAAVVATQVRYDAEGRISSNRYERGSPSDDVIGCSGTVGSTSSYFKKEFTDPAADGKMSLELMGRDENKEVKTLKSPDSDEDYLDEILTSLFDNANDNTRAITDVAGMCKSRKGTPEAVVEALWEKLQADSRFQEAIKGIVYYGKDNVKRLYCGSQESPIECTEKMELVAREGKKFFTFYDQKHTRASDIKQACESHALITLDINTTNNEAKQGILRFRDLVSRASQQSFSFVIMDDFRKEIQQSLNKRTDYKIEAKDVAIYLREKERAAEQRNALNIFNKEMTAIPNQAASHLEHLVTVHIDFDNITDDQLDAYIRFLNERNRIVNIVDKAVTTLHEKYGNKTDDLERDEFIDGERKRIAQQLNGLIEHAKQFAQAVCVTQLSADDEIWEKTKTFYKNQVEDSIHLFTQRYPQDKDVQIPAATDGLCTTIALAEAHAQAQTESMAMALSEKDAKVHRSLGPTSRPIMDKENIPIDLSFLKNIDTPGTTFDVDSYHPTTDLIHSSLRPTPPNDPVITISPHLKKTRGQTLRTHYFVARDHATGSGKDHIVLISSEEAEVFLQADDETKAGFSLFDINEYDSTTNTIPALVGNDWQGVAPQLAKQMRTEMLGLNMDGVSRDAIGRINSTNDLRALPQSNDLPCGVTGDQLLPHLAGTSQEGDLTEIVDIQRFGLTQDCKVGLSVEAKKTEGPRYDRDPKLAAITITMAGKTITISPHSERLNAYLHGGSVTTCNPNGNGETTDKTVTGLLNGPQQQRSRFAQLETALADDYATFEKELQRLTEEEKELARKKKQLFDQIQALTNDAHFLTTSKVYGAISFAWSIEQITEAAKAADKAVASSSGDAEKEGAAKTTAFTGATDETLATIVDGAKEAAFQEAKDFSDNNSLSEQDLVGRTPLVVAMEVLQDDDHSRLVLIDSEGVNQNLTILHLLLIRHYADADFAEAAKTIKSDYCKLENDIIKAKEFFRTIPPIAEQYSAICRQSATLEANIERLRGLCIMPKDAVEKATQILGEEAALNAAVIGQGLRLVPVNSRGECSSPGAFLDLLVPGKLLALRSKNSDARTQAALQGEIPRYNEVVKTLHATISKDRDPSSDVVTPNDEEQDSLRLNEVLLRRTNALAAELELRPGEIRWSK
ncbi:hypothetical protein JYU14_02225 [Simkania negevensis]|uniref:Uncharacterized protein n=1 Tax=Simkania negevensis TaxID=83561 RepID=A0ABS3ARV6_9BACT|nr:hypothetical protein [Simkania negevensis]